jgi:RNA polymerase sigma factor (sigma-70 family)
VSAADPSTPELGDISDAQLVADSNAEGSAFAHLFDRHVDSIYGYIVRRVGRSLAEELTAETFARAFAQRARFVPLNDSAAPWLYGIATNLIGTARRAERRQLAAYERAARAAPDAHDDFEQSNARIDAARAIPQLVRTLAQLEPGDRDALVLFAWQDLTYAEVGAALGIPAGTVASRINRARRRVRASLRMTGDDSRGVGR